MNGRAKVICNRHPGTTYLSKGFVVRALPMAGIPASEGTRMSTCWVFVDLETLNRFVVQGIARREIWRASLQLRRLVGKRRGPTEWIAAKIVSTGH